MYSVHLQEENVSKPSAVRWSIIYHMGLPPEQNVRYPVQYSAVQYCTVQYYTVLYSTGTVLLYCTVLYCTVLYSTVQFIITVQYSTVQYTIPLCPVSSVQPDHISPLYCTVL